ncbi:hypothetical protein HMPREF9431_02084 [Segatella oulorum F0390]|uniref:Uncharacterized protein n=1 Tax=Segatella oulorum F0390 TaxID=702438 RepID=G1WEB2_9BACT|nr:hypothetical protein HMPREF9431_02084 [Segatella oulorum F0390]
MLGLLTIARMDCDGVMFAIVKPWFEFILWVLGLCLQHTLQLALH